MSIITVSREFGSGGRELAKRLADAMGFQYYDKEIVTEIANRTHLHPEYVSEMLEKNTTFPITYATSFVYMVVQDNVTQILSEQSNIIREIAKNGNCVIVGRAADILLADYKPFNIFVHASTQAKLDRCMAHQHDESETEKSVLRKMKTIDKNRKKYRALISDNAWGDANNYHLCIDTTGLEIKQIVPVVAEYAKNWFGQQKK